MPPKLEQALRQEATDLPLAFVQDALGPFSGTEPRQYRPLIEAAQVAADAARAAVLLWVEAGRRAGLSWTDVGELLGISKQAAQQRFGAMETAPVPFGLVAVVAGSGPGDEPALLAAEGAAGRELVAIEPMRLIFRQTDRRWSHLRTTGPLSDAQAVEGWQHVADWFVFSYYKRAD